jgi:hypothetical protein
MRQELSGLQHQTSGLNTEKVRVLDCNQFTLTGTLKDHLEARALEAQQAVQAKWEPENVDLRSKLMALQRGKMRNLVEAKDLAARLGVLSEGTVDPTKVPSRSLKREFRVMRVA